MQSKLKTKHTGNNIVDSTGTKYFNLEISKGFMCSTFGLAHELFRNLSIEIFRFSGIVQECIVPCVAFMIDFLFQSAKKS